MPVHHLLICDHNGLTLIERFYFSPEERRKEANSSGGNSSKNRLKYMRQWKDRVVSLTKPAWKDAYRGVYQVASIGGKFIVYVGSGKLLFIMTGSDDCDEFGLREVLETIINVFKETCFGKKNVGKILDAEIVKKSFGKICVGLDCIIDGGIVDNLNVEFILLQTKLKSLSKFERDFKRKHNKKQHLHH